MANKWVVVAESTRARIFAFQQAGLAMQELEGLTHPASRAHERDLPGRSFDSFGSGRHAMEEEVSLKQQKAIVFAREISDRLELARTCGEFDQLTLVAAPAFLGLLRENLSAVTHKLIVRTIDKSLVQRNEAEIPLTSKPDKRSRERCHRPHPSSEGSLSYNGPDALVEVVASRYRA
ncbi:MAG: host attachment protein [Pseudomonadota bacterium]|nr:host attachment protein [Pseudomonadota bacterium]